LNTFLTFIKKIPLWFWIALAIFIFIAWQSLSGWSTSSKLYKMLLDSLRDDKTQVVKTLEENQKVYESEIKRLNEEAKSLKQKQEIARAETEKLKGLVREKDAEIIALQKERQSIVVSSDPDKLVDELHRMGYSSAHKRINSPR